MNGLNRLSHTQSFKSLYQNVVVIHKQSGEPYIGEIVEITTNSSGYIFKVRIFSLALTCTIDNRIWEMV